jgi:hypothetical protein
MRAKEFVTETKRGKPLAAVAAVNPGTSFTADGDINLYRAAQLMARLPASHDDIDPYSFVTGRPMIVTYTEEEKKMVKDAFRAMGIDYHEDLTSGSKEPDPVYTVSPVKGFNGY